MKAERCAIPDVVLVEPLRHGDARGFFSEVWSRRSLAAAGLDVEFVQDNHAFSSQAGVLRGLHFQRPPSAQGKLVRVARGAILDIARFTPMYGYSGLAHWPQLQGQIIGADETGRDPMWALILNVVVWSAIFGLIAVWAVRRGRRRQ